MLRIADFDGRTARARCVTTHLWTTRLWLACLPSFLSTNGFVMIYSHHQSPLLSPPRHACLRHASRAQARAPTAPSSYHMSQIVRSPAYSAGLCAHDFSVCVPHPGLSLCAMPAASSKLSGCSVAQTACFRIRYNMRSQPHMILLLAYLPGWYLREKEIEMNNEIIVQNQLTLMNECFNCLQLNELCPDCLDAREARDAVIAHKLVDDEIYPHALAKIQDEPSAHEWISSEVVTHVEKTTIGNYDRTNGIENKTIRAEFFEQSSWLIDRLFDLEDSIELQVFECICSTCHYTINKHAVCPNCN
jgi:hypothetical protein